jgi:hypothetical protein
MINPAWLRNHRYYRRTGVRRGAELTGFIPHIILKQSAVIDWPGEYASNPALREEFLAICGKRRSWQWQSIITNI